jgi:hypothetical protein
MIHRTVIRRVIILKGYRSKGQGAQVKYMDMEVAKAEFKKKERKYRQWKVCGGCEDT